MIFEIIADMLSMNKISNRTILLLDDDKTTHVLIKGIIDRGENLISCYTLSEAIEYLENNSPPALVIIDRLLPDGDGLTLCTKLRSDDRTTDLPVMFLSNRDSEADKVTGLFAGADDYLCKDVGPLELKARILARFRSVNKKLSIGNLKIDLTSHRVHLDFNGNSSEIELTRIEFKMLLTLGQAIDQVFSREQLLSAVWGPVAHVSDRVVDTHLSHLRKKLVNSGLKIEALRGEGYRISQIMGLNDQAA